MVCIMPSYRRYYVPGGTYFFTVVSHQRRPFLAEPRSRQCLHEAFEKIRQKWPFAIVAISLMPDHLHTIWTLPPEDAKYSLRWKRIKEEFTRTYLAAGGRELPQSESRMRQGQRGIWQKRFWEHTCRDEEDLKRCLDYVHYNPKKHGLVTSLADWPWSSFHRFVELGEYPREWGKEDPCPGDDSPEWE
jgi:putative transposase